MDESLGEKKFEFHTLWEFLTMQYKYYKPSIHGMETFVNPLDGMYFKYKYIDADDREVIKILQVFTSMIALDN